MAKKFLNKITNETWIADDSEQVRMIGDEPFLRVHTESNPTKFLVNANFLTEILTNEHVNHTNRIQING